MDFKELGTPESGAIFCIGEQYRYKLWRVWDTTKKPMAFIGLNPSVADALEDDPTIRRCIGFAKANGYGGIIMLNLFAYIATDPEDMVNHWSPEGQHNDTFLKDVLKETDMVVACWGTLGYYRGRDRTVQKFFPNLHCLKVTKHGYPNHPLYLKKDLKPIPYKGF